MRAVLFSDLHESFRNLSNLESLIKNENIRLAIFAGDFLDMGETIGFARSFTETFLKLGVDLLWVPGNNDFGHGYHILNSKYKSLEGRVVEYKFSSDSSQSSPEKAAFRFSGVGGSPASWAGQYSGENMIDQVSIKDSIFISHVPPPGLLNYQKFDHNSPSFKKFSDSPLVHICGHIHTKYGVAFLGPTKVIKLAPLLYGHYAIMNLENLSVIFERF